MDVLWVYLQTGESLWLDQVLVTVFVDEFKGSVGATGEDLDVGRVGFAAQAYARSVFGRGDFDVGGALRVDEAQQHRLRISGRAVGHLPVWIGREYLDHC